MELANGGSLEEYIQLQPAPDAIPIADLKSLPPRERAARIKSLRERQRKGMASAASEESVMARIYGGIGYAPTGQRVRYLTTQQIWSIFLDICDGLAHLHKNGIIHRDLVSLLFYPYRQLLEEMIKVNTIFIRNHPTYYFSSITRRIRTRCK
jgi:serine/threonine protein kinase